MNQRYPLSHIYTLLQLPNFVLPADSCITVQLKNDDEFIDFILKLEDPSCLEQIEILKTVFYRADEDDINEVGGHDYFVDEEKVKLNVEQECIMVRYNNFFDFKERLEVFSKKLERPTRESIVFRDDFERTYPAIFKYSIQRGYDRCAGDVCINSCMFIPIVEGIVIHSI